MTDQPNTRWGSGRTRAIAGGASLFAAGALIGGVLMVSNSASAETTSPTPTTASTTAPATPSASPDAPNTTGKWHSNTDPAHEASESAAHAAEESTADASGVVPSWGHGDHGDSSGSQGADDQETNDDGPSTTLGSSSSTTAE